jgi:hypothetical protein
VRIVISEFAIEKLKGMCRSNQTSREKECVDVERGEMQRQSKGEDWVFEGLKERSGGE